VYYTLSATANWTFNFRGNGAVTLASLLAVGQSVTVGFAVTNGVTPRYPNAFKIDDNTVIPKWQGTAAPSSGTASGVDAYVFTIIKTATGTPDTYVVFASQTKFA
jgi:hypothetical protein